MIMGQVFVRKCDRGKVDIAIKLTDLVELGAYLLNKLKLELGAYLLNKLKLTKKVSKGNMHALDEGPVATLTRAEAQLTNK